MRHPGAVEPVGRLTFLVIADLRERGLSHGRVAAIGDERGHAAEGEGTALVARLHEELRVRAHERHSHCHLSSIGEDEFLPLAELLDDAEHVVPASGVQTRAVIAAVTETALAKVRDDKKREATDGFDGTWVAHPDLVETAMSEFDRALGKRPNQLDRQRPEVNVTAEQLLDVRIPGGTITDAGLRTNVNVGIQY